MSFRSIPRRVILRQQKPPAQENEIIHEAFRTAGFRSEGITSNKQHRAIHSARLVNIVAFLTGKGNCRMDWTVLFATVSSKLSGCKLPAVLSDVRLALYGNGVFGARFQNTGPKRGMR